MRGKTLDFFEDKVEYDTPLQSINHSAFNAMYGFVSPFISSLKKIFVINDHRYILYPSEDIEDDMKQLIDKSSVTCGETQYKGMTIFEDGFIWLELVGG